MSRKLTKLELKWLEVLLSYPFEGRDIINDQLKTATIISDKTYISEDAYPYISLKFEIDSTQRFPVKQRVPIQMLAIQSTGDAIDFMLHVIDGYIDELEIYSTNGDAIIPSKIDLDNIKHNVLVNPGDSFRHWFIM